MRMKMQLLVKKSAQNDRIKGELEEALYVAFEGAPKISLKEAQKIARNMKKKMRFTLQLMVHLTVQSRVYL